MSTYSTTRPFPAEIADHVSDLIRASRSAEFFYSDDGTTAQCRAHRSEIASVRRAIRSANACGRGRVMSPILALWQTWPTAHAFELPDDAAEAEREVLRVVEIWRSSAVDGLDREIMTWSSATGIERDVCRHEVRLAIAKYRKVMPFCRRMQALHMKAAARVMETA